MARATSRPIQVRASGTTADFESYSFAARNGRFVRVTVNGNSVNTWASISEIQVEGGEVPPPSTQLSIAAVSASADDGNVPANAVDGNLATRWSCDGIGCFIRLDLGGQKTTNGVKIAWYNGNLRKSSFVVAVSTDGATYAQAFSGQSSGSSTALEAYSFVARSGRYVRITVNGNTVNTWASISEIVVMNGVATPSPTPTSTPAPSPSPSPTQTPAPTAGAAYYGTGLAADALNNSPVGGPYNYKVSYRFKATHSGRLASFRPYVIYKDPKTSPGYSAGNGGTLRFEIQTDDGSSAHNPSGQVLGSALHDSPQTKGLFPLISFGTQPYLQEGSVYHLVATNIASDPKNNFVSLNTLYHYSGEPQQTVSDADWADLRQYAGTWSQRKGNSPILQLNYSDGFVGGRGYMEVWAGTDQRITGNAAVRETFLVSGSNRVVTKVKVRLKRTSGTDPLLVRLERSDGSLIEQGSIAASLMPAGAQTWVTYTFSTPRELLSGQRYFLTLKAASSSLYEAYPIRDGMAAGYGFSSATVFADGYAQFNPGTGWVGWTQWGVTNRSDSDLQFYFVTAP